MRHRGQVAGFRPSPGRVPRGTEHQLVQRMGEPADFFGQPPEMRVADDTAKGKIAETLPPRRLFPGGIAAVLKQVMVQINFHRARFGAGAA